MYLRFRKERVQMTNELAGPGLLRGVRQVQQDGLRRPDKARQSAQGKGFDAFLEEAQANASAGRLRFSAHAMRRLQSRGIEFSRDDLTRLSDAVGQAEAKGSRESLVLMDDLAAIVSIRNRTVVTVLDANNSMEKVFTNIDSTVLARR
ncbi:MAG: hypothetical protein DRH70_04325 [Candidatus Coatesbacteria bacterium]|nr:MAG: hypothetical protein DRH70_04325 [Candidatus Coatesbacteria bacterium]HDM59509.1 hypothetical protein [Bacillota bacterium]